MKKISVLFFLILHFAGCQKDTGSFPQAARQSCETDNQGFIRIFNNTANDWKYRCADSSGAVCASGMAARIPSARITLPAGRIYTITGYYTFGDNGTEYTWDRFREYVPVRTCVTDSISFSDDCEGQDMGYLIYANATAAPLTISIDGVAAATQILPGKTEAFAVAAGVAHQVTAAWPGGDFQATPSVGRCGMSAAVIR